MHPGCLVVNQVEESKRSVSTARTENGGHVGAVQHRVECVGPFLIVAGQVAVTAKLRPRHLDPKTELLESIQTGLKLIVVEWRTRWGDDPDAVSG
jgi:hypothetical protein